MNIKKALKNNPNLARHYAVQRSKLNSWNQNGSIWHRLPDMEVQLMASLHFLRPSCTYAEIAEMLTRNFHDQLAQPFAREVMMSDRVTLNMVQGRAAYYADKKIELDPQMEKSMSKSKAARIVRIDAARAVDHRGGYVRQSQRPTDNGRRIPVAGPRR